MSKKTTENIAPVKVKMKFNEDKFYNDLNHPIFFKGEVYEVEGVEWIQRWLKRGGVIVEGKLPEVPVEVNVGTVVAPAAAPGPTLVGGEEVPKQPDLVKETEDAETEEEETEEDDSPKGRGNKSKGKGRR